MPLKPLKVSNLGEQGVNVDVHPAAMGDGELRKAQNAVRGADGEERALITRPGLKKFNVSAMSGRVLGSFGVPIGRGGSGRRNTWGWWGGDGSAWRTWIGWPTWGDWGDIGWWDFWDWWQSPEGGDPNASPDDGAGTTPRVIYVATTAFSTVGAGVASGLFLSEWHKGSAAFQGAAAEPVSVPGVPEGANTYVIIGGNHGGTPVTNGYGAPFFTILNGAVYYPGSANPRSNIRRFDGLTDAEVARLPDPPTGELNPTQVVHSILSGGGSLYIAVMTKEGSTDAKSGLVYQASPPNVAGLSQLGLAFADNYWPYSLCWHMGRLFVGTMSKDSTKAGRVYYIRPDIDSVFTLDHTSSNPLADVLQMVSYRGELFAALQSRSTTFAIIEKRDTQGAWTTSLTATGGSAVNENGFRSMVVFNDAIYASFYNPDGTPVAKIYKFNGSSWSAVYTAASSATRIPYHLAVDNGLMYAFGGYDSTMIMLTTADGTTWTDRSTAFAQTSWPHADTGKGPIPMLFGLGPDGVGD